MNLFKKKLVPDEEVRKLMEKTEEEVEEEIERRKWVMEHVVAMILEETLDPKAMIAMADAAYGWVWGERPR